jgi:hypothetical protein
VTLRLPAAAHNILQKWSFPSEEIASFAIKRAGRGESRNPFVVDEEPCIDDG